MSEAMQAEAGLVSYDMVEVRFVEAATGEWSKVRVGEPREFNTWLYTRDLGEQRMTREQAGELARALLATRRREP